MPSPRKRKKHPTDAHLAAFIAGQLSPRNARKIEKHLEKCDVCVDRLDDMPTDSLSSKLKKLGPQKTETPETRDSETKVAATSFDQKLPASLRNHPRFEIVEKIGDGGMGEVYRGRQKSMDRPVAIKVLRQSLFADQRAVARFRNEVKVAARLNHPNIVHSYDADVSDDVNILVMELVDGVKLSEIVSNPSTLSPVLACRITYEIAKGLHYANDQGMIHRDIKPQNILVLPNRSIKITDFGLAKFIQDSVEKRDGALTREGEVFGTPDYIAPEQIRNSARTDARADIYSLGCTFFFMLTGRPPFPDGTSWEKLAAHLETRPPEISKLRDDVDPILEKLVNKMMEKETTDRYQDYQTLLDDLAEQLPSEAESPTMRFSEGNQVDLATKVDLSAEVGKLEDSTRSFSGELDQLPSMNRVARTKRFRIFTALIGFAVFGLLILGLAVLIFPEYLSFGKTTRVAVVVPAVDAWHPEIQRLKRFFDTKKVEIEFVAERLGRVSFQGRKNNSEPSLIMIHKTITELDPKEFSGAVFTGGWNGSDTSTTRYGFDEELIEDAKWFIDQMIGDNKPVGSICGGTFVLGRTGHLQGKRAANCRYLTDRLRTESRARWTPVPDKDELGVVVTDGLVITAGNYVNSEELAAELMKIIEGRQ